MLAPALIVAAPASGSGKTVITLALLRALRRRGVAVASFKVGPDYVDPAFHAAAGGGPCRNLDGWAMRPETIASLAARIAESAELVIGEGVMGLFDGAAGGGGSTADLAASLELPVLLVVDVRGQAASAAALIRGFAGHRQDLVVAGVIFNRVAGARHQAMLEDACAGLGPALLGGVPRDPRLALPERHLGLVPAGEHPRLEGFLDTAAEIVAAHVDIDALTRLARPPRLGPAAAAPLAPLGQRIAIARDAAFAFSYAHIDEGWRAHGAELLPFSPLADEAPAADADAIFLPGGYPELHAGRLAACAGWRDGLAAAAARGTVIYGECGGFMALGDGLVDGDGTRHAMAGLLRLETSFARPKLHLGYRRLALPAAAALGRAGARFRGHEFHYAEIVSVGDHAPLFEGRDSAGQALGPLGLRQGRVMGSFIHLVDAA